jgi:uncharacterized protein
MNEENRSATMSVPIRPFTAASFYQYMNEKKLMAARCGDCGGVYLPPRAICPRCHSERLEWLETSGKGKLAAFTAIGVGPTFMVQAGFGRDNPYVTGIVEMEEGVKISARILGVDAHKPESIQIGTPVTVAFVEQGEGEASKTYLAFQVSQVV